MKDFQQNHDVQVALLSLTACSQGLTLNSASVVVFADRGWQVVVKRLAHCSLGKSEGQFAGKYGICMDICCSSYFSLDMWSACAFDST